MNNYANNVFEAIDTIINQRLSELSFDRTITCKIIEEVKDSPNTYWVSNDNMRFQAIAQDGKKYNKKEEVFVLIPNGEYNNEKIITGSRIDNSKNGYNKMKYISTKEQFVEYNTIKIDGSITNYTDSIDQEFNNFIHHFLNSNQNETFYKYDIPIEYIGLSFSLNTLNLFKNDEKTGQYAISIGFLDKAGNILHGELDNVSEYTIYSQELYGNPYAFTNSFKHFMLLPFKIQDITQIDQIVIKFIQDGNFDNGNIELTLSDISLSFGFEKGSKNIPTTRLFTATQEDIKYITDYDKNNKPKEIPKQIYLDLNLNNNIYNYLNPLSDSYGIKYFKYTDGHGHDSDIVDTETDSSWTKIKSDINNKLYNWKLIETVNPFNPNVMIDTKQPAQSFKAVIAYNKNDDGQYQSYVFTDILRFENSELLASQSASSSNGDLQLVLNNSGIYNIYGFDGSCSDKSQLGPYSITAQLNGDKKWDQVEKITWEFPDDLISMLSQETTAADSSTDELEQVVSYRLKDKYQTGISNNTVKCIVKFKEIEEPINATISFQFGYISTSGSNYALNIDFADRSKNHLTPYAKLTLDEKWEMAKQKLTEKEREELKNPNDTDKKNIIAEKLTSEELKQAEMRKNAIEIKATFTKRDGTIVETPDIYWSWVFGQDKLEVYKYENETGTPEKIVVTDNIYHELKLKKGIKTEISEDKKYILLPNGYNDLEISGYGENNPIAINAYNIQDETRILLGNNQCYAYKDAQGQIIPLVGIKYTRIYDEINKKYKWNENYQKIEITQPHKSIDKNFVILNSSQIDENGQTILGDFDDQIFIGRYPEDINTKAEFATAVSAPPELKGTSIWIQYKGQSMPLIEYKDEKGNKKTIFENYSILKAEIKNYPLDNGLSSNLTAYLPIPIGKSGIKNISGDQIVVYEGLGNKASMSGKPYELLPAAADKTSVWEIQCDETQLNNTAHFEKPKLRIVETLNYIGEDDKELETPEFDHNEYSLQIPQYAPTTIPKVCVRGGYRSSYFKSEKQTEYTETMGDVQWISPILILQDTWDKELLNEWNGSFKIDEEEGIIMSSLLVAGKKEGNNEFTGVLVGDVAKAGGVERHTGVYGYKLGDNRFRLTDTGEFYVGSNENNRIHLDEDGNLFINSDQLKIEATTINIDSDYMKLDDKEGLFTLHSKKNANGQYDTTYFSFNESSAQISGFTLTNTGMGKVWQNKNGTNMGIWLESKPNQNGYFINCIGNASEFQVKEDGSVSLSGEISATSGKATSWKIYLETDFQDKSYLGEVGAVEVPYTLDTKTFGLITKDSMPVYIVSKGGAIYLQSRGTTADKTAGITINPYNSKNDGVVINLEGYGHKETVDLDGLPVYRTGIQFNSHDIIFSSSTGASSPPKGYSTVWIKTKLQ